MFIHYISYGSATILNLVKTSYFIFIHLLSAFIDFIVL